MEVGKILGIIIVRGVGMEMGVGKVSLSPYL